MIHKYTHLLEECIQKGKWGTQAQKHIQKHHPTTPPEILNQIPQLLTQPALYACARHNMHQHYTNQVQNGADPITATKKTRKLYPWYWNPTPDTPPHIRRVIPYTMNLITNPEYITAGANGALIYLYAHTHIKDLTSPIFVVPVLEAAMRTLEASGNKREILGHLLLWSYSIIDEVIIPRQVIDEDVGPEVDEFGSFIRALLSDLDTGTGRAIALSDLVMLAARGAPGLFEVWLRRACDMCGVGVSGPDTLLGELFEL